MSPKLNPQLNIHINYFVFHFFFWSYNNARISETHIVFLLVSLEIFTEIPHINVNICHGPVIATGSIVTNGISFYVQLAPREMFMFLRDWSTTLTICRGRSIRAFLPCVCVCMFFFCSCKHPDVETISPTRGSLRSKS